MKKFAACASRASAVVVTLLVCSTPQSARAADYSGGARRGAPPPQVIEGSGPYVFGRFIPEIDPRCRIIPDPQMNLRGDVVLFGQVAVCQSRGLYADSVSFPDSVFVSEYWR